jgi:hypothetical protein
LDHFAFKVLLKHISVGRTYSFVVILFQINDFETELLVEFDCAFIVHLDVSAKREIEVEVMGMRGKGHNLQENVVKVCVGFDILEDVIQHNGSDSESPVRIQTAQSHYVQSPLVCNAIDSAANRTYDDVIVISELCKFSRF